MARESRETWAGRVARWKRSGLSRDVFAAREGVKATTLSWWRWRLGSVAPSPTKGISFVDVDPVAFETAGDRFEVALQNGRVVRVPAVFDDAALLRVLAVAEGR